MVEFASGRRQKLAATMELDLTGGHVNTIDADGHIVEKDADVRKHLPEPHSKRGRPLLPSDGMDTGMGGLVGGLEDCDVPTRLKDMDKEGIDTSVLFPTSSFAVNGLIERNYAVAYARAYNDFIAVATQGMKEHLGSQTFWPIYEELQRLNVPLCVHNRRAGPAGEIRFDSFMFMHTIGRPVETLIQFVGLIYGGIPERFSKLRIAFLECGVGWIPYWMERMDEEWEKRGKIEAPACKQKPSDYVKQGNLFFATEPEEETLPYVLERIGDDKILFASDYPHWDGIFPYVVSTIRGRKDISEQAKNRILGENAKRFYGWQ